jgi:replication-associated recombination protein RarA
MELFPEFQDKVNDFPPAPLADRMRPRGLQQFLGQATLLGEGTVAILLAAYGQQVGPAESH